MKLLLPSQFVFSQECNVSPTNKHGLSNEEMKFVENAASLSEDKHKNKSTSPSCIKMTDQAQHLNGDVNNIKVTVNGNFTPKKHTSQGHPNHNNSADVESGGTTLGGGRLKFFKGKKQVD